MTAFKPPAAPALLGLILASTLLAGCSVSSIWPFNKDNDTGQAVSYANATEYNCNSGKGFWLRMLASGDAWVIYPDRQVRLDKTGDAASKRYSNGIAVLEFTGNEATLSDGPAISYTGCTPATAKR